MTTVGIDSQEKEFLFRVISQFDKPTEVSAAVMKLDEEDFVEPKNKAVYKIYRKLNTKGEEINFVSLYHESQKVGTEKQAREMCAYVAEMADGFRFSPLVHAAKMVREKTISRKLKHYAKLIQEQGDASEKLGEWQRRIAELEQERIEVNAMQHLMAGMMEDMTEGLTTGIDVLDKRTIGLKKGHFWVIGGYTNVGKTQVAMQMLDHLHEHKKEPKIAFISLEMEPKDLMLRLYRAKLQRLTREYPNQTDAQLEGYISQSIEKRGFEVVKHVRSLNEIRNYVLDGDFDVVFVDFIQNVLDEGKNLFERMESVSLGFQNLAHDAECCIVALSQVNEEYKKSGKHGTTGFKGGGGIGSACDVGVVLDRNFDDEKEGDDAYPFYVILRKNRFGRTGEYKMSIDAKTGYIS